MTGLCLPWFVVSVIWKNLLQNIISNQTKNVLVSSHMCPDITNFGQYSLYRWNYEILKQLAHYQDIFFSKYKNIFQNYCIWTYMYGIWRKFYHSKESDHKKNAAKWSRKHARKKYPEYAQRGVCMPHSNINVKFCTSRLCMKMSSFLFVHAWAKLRRSYLSCGVPFPVWTPDNISGLIAVVLWLLRWEIINTF